MYQIEIKHDGLNKYRVIKGTDKYVVEQKARVQLMDWDNMWKKKQALQAEKAAREKAASEKEQKREGNETEGKDEGRRIGGESERRGRGTEERAGTGGTGGARKDERRAIRREQGTRRQQRWKDIVNCRAVSENAAADHRAVPHRRTKVSY